MLKKKQRLDRLWEGFLDYIIGKKLSSLISLTFSIGITGLEIKNHFKKFLNFLRKFQPIEDKDISKTDEGMIKFFYFYAY